MVQIVCASGIYIYSYIHNIMCYIIIYNLGVVVVDEVLSGANGCGHVGGWVGMET